MSASAVMRSIPSASIAPSRAVRSYASSVSTSVNAAHAAAMLGACDTNRVLGRKHGLRAGGDAGLRGAYHQRRVEAAERALVADVGAEEVAAAGTDETRAVPLRGPDRVREARRHPLHRHAVRHDGTGALVQSQTARVLARGARELALPELRHAPGGHPRAPTCLDSSTSGRAPALVHECIVWPDRGRHNDRRRDARRHHRRGEAGWRTSRGGAGRMSPQGLFFVRASFS